MIGGQRDGGGTGGPEQNPHDILKFIAEVMDDLPLPIAVITYPGLVYVVSNRANTNMLCSFQGPSFGKEDFLGKAIPDIPLFKTDPTLMGALREAAETGKTVTGSVFEADAGRASGRAYKMYYCPLFQDVTETYVLRIAADVTDEVLAKREAEKSALDIVTLFNNVAEGIVIRDSEGRLLLFNQKAVEITGVSAGPYTSVQHTQLPMYYLDGRPIPPEGRLYDRMMRGEKVSEEEYLLRRPDGSIRNVIYTGGSLEDAGGNRLLLVTTFHDVTEEREEQKAKDQFISTFSAELRKPLAVVRGLIQKSREGMAGAGGGGGTGAGTDARAEERADEVEGYLSRAETELIRLTGLVNDMYTGYRVASGHVPLDRRALALSKVVGDALAQDIPGKETHKLLVSGVPEGAQIMGDRRRLADVVGSLLSNAFNYSPRGTRVWIDVKVESGAAFVRVQDEGIGIPEGELEQVFSGFHRGSNLNRRDPVGSGLSLFVSREVARRHGGDLWAERRPGGGTIMVLRLPLRNM